jgi:hypothetical protein
MGEVARERLALRDAYVVALDAYRREAWEAAHAVSRAALPLLPAICQARYSTGASLSFALLRLAPTGTVFGRWRRSSRGARHRLLAGHRSRCDGGRLDPAVGWLDRFTDRSPISSSEALSSIAAGARRLAKI